MTITREMLLKKIAQKSGFRQEDIKWVLQCLDDIVFDELCKVESDEDVAIQIIQGAKFSASVVPQRERVDPRNGNPITCKPTVKVTCKFSRNIKQKLQEDYDKRHNQ